MTRSGLEPQYILYNFTVCFWSYEFHHHKHTPAIEIFQVKISVIIKIRARIKQKKRTFRINIHCRDLSTSWNQPRNQIIPTMRRKVIRQDLVPVSHWSTTNVSINLFGMRDIPKRFVVTHFLLNIDLRRAKGIISLLTGRFLPV